MDCRITQEQEQTVVYCEHRNEHLVFTKCGEFRDYLRNSYLIKVDSAHWNQSCPKIMTSMEAVEILKCNQWVVFKICLTEILPYDRCYLQVCLWKPSAVYPAVRCGKIKQAWPLINVYSYEVHFSVRSERSFHLTSHKFVPYNAH